MTQDLVERLRIQAKNFNARSPSSHEGDLLDQAADEIEFLRTKASIKHKWIEDAIKELKELFPTVLTHHAVLTITIGEANSIHIRIGEMVYVEFIDVTLTDQSQVNWLKEEFRRAVDDSNVRVEWQVNYFNHRLKYWETHGTNH